MELFINHPAAMEFLDQIKDPIVRNLVLQSYGTLIFKVAPVQVDGQFDLLFFFKVMEAFLRNREELAQALRGESDEVNGEKPEALAKEVAP